MCQASCPPLPALTRAVAPFLSALPLLSPSGIDGGLCHTCVAVQFLSLLSLAFFTAIPIIPKADPEIPSNKLPACKSLLQSLFLGGPVSESKSKILIMTYLLYSWVSAFR